MKSNFCTLLLLFLLNVSFSQNYKVLDSITKEPIPFVAIKFSSNDGLYANENGEFQLDEKKHDSIIISCLGYHELKQSIDKLSKIIYLIPKAEELKEVVVSDKKPIIKTIGFLKKRRELGWQIKSKHEFISIIKPNKNYENVFIEKIHIPIKKSIFNDSLSNRIGVLRINIYSVKNNHPNEKIFSSIPIKYTINKKDEITLDVSNEIVALKKEGIGIGIEQIGIINSKEEIINNENSVLSLKFTSRQNKDFSSITFYKYVFSNKKELFLISDFMKNNAIVSSSQTLMLSLTISVKNE